MTKAYPITVPADDRPVVQLYEHQKAAFERYKDAEIIPLFFEMGCGKSVTTLRIAEYKHLKGEIEGLLVIAPNDVHRQWYDELVRGLDVKHDGTLWREIASPFHAQCVGGSSGQDKLYPFEDDGLFRFVSVNVDTFSTKDKWREVLAWANSGRYMIAVDEATVIKNPKSKRGERILYGFNDVERFRNKIISSKKKFPVRAVLTGTPVTNGPMDLWAIMEFVQPNYFGMNEWAFKHRYAMFTRMNISTGVTSNGSERTREVDVMLNERMWHNIKRCMTFEQANIMWGCSEDTYLTVKGEARYHGPYKRADELKRKLELHATFVKLTDCIDMPQQNYITRTVTMSKEQQKAYSSMKNQMLTVYDGKVMTAMSKLSMLMRLQQISSGFIVSKAEADAESFADWENMDVMPDEVTWLGETNPRLDALMRDVAEADKPLLILTHYSAEAAKIYELCEKAGFRTGLFTGWKVAGGIDAFKNGELDVLVANSAKISRGFNLQNAHTTLFYSNTYSMETRQQAEFRTFRIGQKQPCTYYDYVASEADEAVLSSLRMKKGMLDYLRDADMRELV